MNRLNFKTCHDYDDKAVVHEQLNIAKKLAILYDHLCDTTDLINYCFSIEVFINYINMHTASIVSLKLKFVICFSLFSAHVNTDIDILFLSFHHIYTNPRHDYIQSKNYTAGSYKCAVECLLHEIFAIHFPKWSFIATWGEYLAVGVGGLDWFMILCWN